MVDSARVDRTLATARQHFGAPLQARERVRAELAHAGHWPASETRRGAPAARRLTSARAAGVSWPAAALLSALTFAAGYWVRGASNEPARLVPAEPAFVGTSPSSPRAQPAASASSVALTPPAPVADVASAALEAAPRDGVSPRERRAEPALAPPRARAAPRRPRAVLPDERARAAGDELDLLKRADRAIRAGEPELALSFLDELEHRHPKTRLAEERSAARLLAGCARADAEARARAAEFLRSHPTSVYSERIRELCELDEHAGDGRDVSGH